MTSLILGNYNFKSPQVILTSHVRTPLMWTVSDLGKNVFGLIPGGFIDDAGFQ